MSRKYNSPHRGGKKSRGMPNKMSFGKHRSSGKGGSMPWFARWILGREMTAAQRRLKDYPMYPNIRAAFEAESRQ